MSRRFGRNQKRKLVNEVVCFKTQLIEEQKINVLNTKTVRNCKDEIRKLKSDLAIHEQVIENVSAVLGKYFIGLNPEIAEVDFIQSSMFLRKPFSFESLDFTQDKIPVQMKARPLNQIINRLNTHCFNIYRDDLREKVHVHFKTPDGEIAYVISTGDSYLLTQDRYQNEIAIQFANYIERNFRNCKAI